MYALPPRARPLFSIRNARRAWASLRRHVVMDDEMRDKAIEVFVALTGGGPISEKIVLDNFEGAFVIDFASWSISFRIRSTRPCQSPSGACRGRI